MTTTNEYLEDIDDALKAIKTSIIAKGQTPSGDISTYSSAIDDIDTTNLGYRILVVDYDGEVIAELFKHKNETYTLPTPPTHTGLVFKEWSSSATITNNTVTVTDNDIMIGPIYTTSSGYNEFDIKLDEETGLTFYVRVAGEKDWGDGTIDTEQSHTYANYGEYTIIYKGTTTAASMFRSATTTSYAYYNFSLINARCANMVFNAQNIFSYCKNLETVTLANTNTFTSNNSLFAYCQSLKSIVFPQNMKLNSSECTYCSNLKYAVIPNNTSIALSSTFSYCFNLKYAVLPANITSLSGTFSYCYTLEKVIIPTFNNPNITSLNFNSMFNYCYNLKSCYICHQTKTITTFNSMFQSCFSLDKVIFEDETFNNLTSISSMFQSCYTLKTISLPNLPQCNNINNLFYYCYNLSDVTLGSFNDSVTTSGAFYFCSLLNNLNVSKNILKLESSMFVVDNAYINHKDYNFLEHTSTPSVIGVAFPNIGNPYLPTYRFNVPRNLYQEWLRTSNWKYFKNQIYGGKSSNLTFNITPSTAELYMYNEKKNTTSFSFIGTEAPYCVYNPSNNTIYCGKKKNIAEESSYTINVNTTGTSHTLTLSVGQSYCDVRIKIFGNEFKVPENSTTGNYIINIISDESSVDIDYTVNYSLATAIKNGTITFTNTNKTENISLTIGRDTYTDMVTITTNDQTHAYISNYTYNNAYYAFNGNKTSGYINLSYTYFQGDYGLVRKYDTAVVLNKIYYYPYSTSSSYNPQNLVLYGSNNGTDWTNLGMSKIRNYGSSLSSTSAIELKYNNYTAYTYYKFMADYSGGPDYSSIRFYQLDCPTWSLTQWDSSKIRTFSATTNEIADRIKVITSYGTFNIPVINSTTAIGYFVADNNESIQYIIEKDNYKNINNNVTVTSSTISVSGSFSDLPYTVDFIPNVPAIITTPNSGWHIWKDNVNGNYMSYESTTPFDTNTSYNYSIMKITLKEAKTSFKIYIDTYGYGTNSSITAYAKNSTSSTATSTNTQKDPAVLSNYTAYTYSNLVEGDYIYISYRHYYNSIQNNDAGYVLIDPNQ